MREVVLPTQSARRGLGRWWPGQWGAGQAGGDGGCSGWFHVSQQLGLPLRCKVASSWVVEVVDQVDVVKVPQWSIITHL